MGQGRSKIAKVPAEPTFADRAFEIASTPTGGDPRSRLRCALWLFAWENRERLGYGKVDAPVPEWDVEWDAPDAQPLTSVDMWIQERCLAGLAPKFSELLDVITLLSLIGGPAWDEFEKHVEKRVLDFHLDNAV